MISNLEWFILRIAVCLTTVFFSCNNADDPKPETKSIIDTVLTPAADTAGFKPFDVAEISIVVKDYDKWRPGFDADSIARKASGIDYTIVSSAFDKPNNITVILITKDISKAKAFIADPRLKEVMDKNGVISKPEVNYFHVIRYNPEAKEDNWVTLTHKVKDFNAWVKVFDEEGTANRAAFGLYDAILARGIDDPNLVQMIFDIKDKAKAEARLNDPALKKLMTDAGVEGMPKIVFYKGKE